MDPKHQEAIVRDARAVFHAIREPTDAMALAGGEVIRNIAPAETAVDRRADAASTWRFMVAAAMDER